MPVARGLFEGRDRRGVVGGRPMPPAPASVDDVMQIHHCGRMGKCTLRMTMPSAVTRHIPSSSVGTLYRVRVQA